MSSLRPAKPAASEHRRSRASLAVRWGTWVARRRWWMLAAWAAILLASALAYPHLTSSLVPADSSVTGSESDEVAVLIETDFSAAGAEQDAIVFDSERLTIRDAAYARVVRRVLARVKDKPGVVSVLGPTDTGARDQVSEDGHAALAALGLSGDDQQRSDRAASLQDTIESAAGSGPVEANLTGYSPSANDLTDVENADVERAESFGVPVAFIVLLLALGAVVAAFLPLAIAVLSITATLGVLSLLVAVTAFKADGLMLSIVTMIGVGVSIDYSLFVLSRFREELVRARDDGQPDPVPAAVGTAMTTSGRTIVFSGTIVIVSLCSLLVVNSPLFRAITAGAVLVVLCTLMTAWTALPALLGALGDRVNRWGLPERFQPAGSEQGAPERETGWARWARTVIAHPWLAAPAAALLILFALPTFGIKVGLDLGLAALSDTHSGKAAVVLAEKLSPGAMSPIQILASHPGSGSLSNNDLTTIKKLTKAMAKHPRVTDAYSISVLLKETTGEVSPRALSALKQDRAARPLLAQTVNVGDGLNRTIVTVIPSVPIDSTEATELVDDLRDQIIPSYTSSGGPQMLVGGATAQFVDLSSESIDKLPLVLGAVLLLSFVYLLVIFRSLLIPAKAVLMNLLATAAAFGLTVWVFQEGHLEGLLGFTSVGFVQVYLPIMVFAVLFGLAMDYEVFLVRRMQEHWLATHDNEEAVVVGIAHTARPIVAAAAIMAAVFGCFLVADVLELKEFGLALALAVILDATIVRLLLVPAIMSFAGTANWWLPSWLERILPRIRVD